MNELTVKRELHVVENEIISLRNQAQQQALMYAVEIGRRLTEAKELVPHGGWAEWLEKKVEFKQRTANNFMRIFEEYGNGQMSLFGNSSNSQALANLNYTQLIALLALPGEERETFAEENDVEKMTTRELEKAVKERKEALERAEAAEKKAELYEIEKAKAERLERQAEMSAEKSKDLQQELISTKEALEKAKASEKNAKNKLKALKENPTVPQEVIDKANAEAEAAAAEKSAKALKEKTAELNEKLRSVEEAKKAAELAAEQAREKTAELEKKLKMQNPNVENFKRMFEQAQNDVFKLFEIIKEVKAENTELAEKFTAATLAFLNKYAKEN
ncbi:MAG: DUF3102 domain-containing protein [Clostridia bacterium]|nr:DUF3102 domain-containing protein [Clostridia bacterium]